MRLQIFALLAATGVLTAAAPSPAPPPAKDDIDARVDAIIAAGKARTSVTGPGCSSAGDTDAIVVCGDRDADTRYRQAEDFREKRTAIKGGVPDAPDVSFAPQGGVTVATGCFIGPCPKEPILPYTADQLPVVDPEYLERARKAEAQERLRQRGGKTDAQKPGG